MLSIQQRVIDSIDIEEMLDYLSQLVAIKSLGGHESSAQKNVANQMQQCGLDVDIWDIDFSEISKHPSYSIEIERRHGLGVVGVMGEEGDGNDLILNGHVDVVPIGVESNWSYPPWQATITDKFVYGRGALDMKGGLCCALFAAKALHKAGVRLKGKLMIESVIAEEDGGAGTLAAILRGYKADGAIVVEPTNLAVVPSQAGALNFRITISGRSAHGAVRHHGVSAIEKFYPIYQALMDLEGERNQSVNDPLFAHNEAPFPICIGTIQGGDWASTVAEKLTFEGRYGVTVGEDIAKARQLLEETVFHAAQSDPWLSKHPPKVEWWGAQFEPASISKDHPIVTELGSAFDEITGIPAIVEGVPYGADMRLLVNDGQTPTVLFGPGDVKNAHMPDEFVPIEDLVTVVRTLAITALNFCGYHEEE